MKADVLQFVSDLSFGQADSVAAERYYRDVVDDLGRQPVITQATLVSVTAGTALYTMPGDAIRRLGVIFDDEELSEATLRELEWVDPAWRDRRGRPEAYTAADESSEDVRLYPMPDVSSKPFDFSGFGSPLGRDYPESALVFIHTERRDDLPSWLDLPLAFEILAREFNRPSSHQDAAFAQVCRQAAGLLLRMVL